MSIDIGKTLPVRVAVTAGVAALLFILLSSVFFYKRTYHKELQVIDKTLEQLATTVAYSAAIAAYLGNNELASDVAIGLAQNDIVLAASVSGLNGMTQASGDMTPQAGLPLYRFNLDAPFPPIEPVGKILIKPNQQLIESTAQQAALSQVLNLVLYTLLLLALVAYITHAFLTRPIRRLANRLHTIEPGSPQRLDHFKWHRKNEIGELVNDVNALLGSVSQTLARERQLRSEIEALERRFRLIFERASGGIALTDLDGRLQMFNPSFERIFGEQHLQTIMQSKGACFADLFREPKDVADTLKLIPGNSTTMARDLQLPLDNEDMPRWLHCLFSSVTDESGEMLIETIVYDISERTQREQLTRVEAEQDPLTGLFNRRAGERHLHATLENAQTSDQSCALLMIDLDNFKPINDTHGHDAGDQVLKEIAKRLTDSLRTRDFIVRWGGDEFLIVLVQGHGMLDPSAVANAMLEQINVKIDLGNGVQGQVGASIGISIFPEHSQQANQLIEMADHAMYEAKQQGRNRFKLFSKSPEDKASP